VKRHHYHINLTVLLLITPLSSMASPSTSAFSVGFSPSHTALAEVLEEINNAQHTIDVEAYSFTSKEISKALVRAKKCGRGGRAGRGE